MKASTRGLLLSGLVYPGFGQLLSGNKKSGLIFVLATSAGLMVLFYRLMQRVLRVVDEALPELTGSTPDISTVKELLGRGSTGSWGVEAACLIGLAVIWLAAILHAYVIGKRLDSQTRSN